MRYKNIAGRFFGVVTKHACDGQTNGQNYDSQARASIAVSRGKMVLSFFIHVFNVLNFYTVVISKTLENGVHIL